MHSEVKSVDPENSSDIYSALVFSFFLLKKFVIIRLCEMSGIEENFEEIEIPSDCESHDDIENSEDESSIIENVVLEESFEFSDDTVRDDMNGDVDEDDDTPLSVRNERMDGIWEKKRKRSFNPPFTEETGPKNFSDDIQNPGEVFLCLFSEQIIQLIVEQTNLYIKHKGMVSEATTSEEIMKFLGLNILMGMKRLPSYRDYWSTNLQMNDPYISSVMPVKRFSFLLSNLHLNDTSKEPKRNEPGYDKLYKVAPFLDIVSETYKHFYNPTKNQAIDESMIKFKGRSSMKQYMPMKPIKRGYKVWVRADEYGYICEFQMYTGKIGNKTESLLGERVIKDLSQVLAHKNYRIYFDNYFTTVNLMASLLNDGILACGTVRKDRKDLPKIQEVEKNMSPGDSEFRTSYKGVQWLKWIDKKPVHFLSNFHDPSVISHVNRRQKDGSLREVTCPQMAKDYNSHMGCVDKADMLKSYYEISRKSKKWWHRIFWHFVDATLVNSFIIYRLLFPTENLSLKNFRLSVVDHLIGVPNRPKRGRPSIKYTLPHQKPKVCDTIRTSQVSHFPGVQTRRRCSQ